MCVGLRERLRVLVGAHAVRALVHAGVRACICMHDLPY